MIDSYIPLDLSMLAYRLTELLIGEDIVHKDVQYDKDKNVLKMALSTQ